MSNAVQRLYELCKATFVGNAVPSPSEIQRLRSLLNSIKPSDVGLDSAGLAEDQRGFGYASSNGRRGARFPLVPRFSPPITYLHVYECSEFSMGIFCLPTSAVIPLHDHPGMTVLSKLLHGSMHVRSFDWLSPPKGEKGSPLAGRPRLAKRVLDEVMTAPCDATTLFPTSGGNIHAFTALTPCAVLDVLAPPYCPDGGRHCTYYHEVSFSGGGFSSGKSTQRKGGGGGGGDEQSREVGWLEAYEPEGVIIKSGVYKGPKVIPS
ncbi:hypothetical protein CBR_g713 [Chara braunii]|uniref:cysteine dioxygenase n=1 Tax=Chara braunii TaxID=69332 RepID=A0A388KBZ3_CHABU|nr:hypothetical protein CBR_g713 [Chara braunii]|eukprot:GBG67584.1 hypothetical protein CBR_g713 [Chara braunii]